jgi:putative cardiolipin synthase
MENPYFIPTETWQNAFQKALDRGVRVCVLTNSTETNDLTLYQAAYRRQRKKLLRMGIELWEYQGPKKLHVKAAVIDDSVAVIGSYNIHYPSEKLNTEVAAWVADARHAGKLEQAFAIDFERALKVGKNNRLIREEGKPLKKAPFKRRLAVFLYQHSVAIFFGKYL